MVIRTNCNYKIHALNYSNLVLDFALQEVAGAVRASNGAVHTSAQGSSALARALHA